MSYSRSNEGPDSARRAGRLVLRADGNSTIGLGHIMRLLALADILRNQFTETIFALCTPDESLRQLLASKGLSMQELPAQPLPTEAQWLALNFLRPDDTVVFDGYGFDYEYQCQVRAAVRRLVCLDDLHAFPFAADLVLNPAGGISANSYELRQRGARILSGPAYAPLQAAFREVSNTKVGSETEKTRSLKAAKPASPDTVLLCLGGADPRHLSQQVATELLGLPESAVCRLHVVVGAAYQGWEALSSWAAPQPRVTLHRALTAAELALLMRSCGAAVLSSSTVSYEYCAAGGGLLFTLATADNQHDLDQFLRGAGLALPYLSAPNVLTSPEVNRTAAQLQTAQQRHFDGMAPIRLQQAFAALQVSFPPPPFELRRATAAESELLLTWANDPVVRQYSFSTEPVSRITHEAWFAARLADPNSLLLLAEDIATGSHVGLIRFQVEFQVATLSYQLAADWRGRGLAAPLLLAGAEAVQHRFSNLRQIRGQVQASNLASVRAFERAGFSLQASAANAPAGSLTFVWIV
jgi:UDP-2,4-diacetamido-2,4,6-trideoxy-beta-L-altropyranose hydrolase